MTDPRDLQRQAEQVAQDARQLRHAANRAEADRLWNQGSRGEALAYLYASGHGDLTEYCRDKGLTGDEIDAAIREANIDFR